MFSIASCLGLFAIEAIYIVAVYDPRSTHTQAGLMIVFALEASYLVKIGQANLDEKRTLGRISGKSRLYSAMFMLPLLGVMAIAVDLFHVEQNLSLWIGLFFISACGKIAWQRNREQRRLVHLDGPHSGGP